MGVTTDRLSVGAGGDSLAVALEAFMLGGLLADQKALQGSDEAEAVLLLQQLDYAVAGLAGEGDRAGQAGTSLAHLPSAQSSRHGQARNLGHRRLGPMSADQGPSVRASQIRVGCQSLGPPPVQD